MKNIIKKYVDSKILWIAGIILPGLFAIGAQYINASIGSSIILGLENRHSFVSILIGVGVAIASYIILEIFWAISYYCMLKTENSLDVRLRELIFEKIIRINLYKHNNLDEGKLLLNLNTNISSIVQLITNDVYSIINSLIMSIGICIFIMSKNMTLGFIVLLLVISVLFINSYYVNIFKKLEKNKLDTKAAYLTFNKNILHAKELVRIQNMDNFIEEEIKLKSDEIFKTQKDIYKAELKKSVSMDWFVFACATLILPFACVLASMKKLNLPEVIFILQLSGNVIWFSKTLGTSILSYNKNMVSLESFNEIINYQQEVFENKDDYPLNSECDIVLDVKDLSVSYDNKKILDNISFMCSKGKITVITGPSGKGKTSIFHALLGMANFSGDIMLYGNTVNDNFHYARKFASYVPEHCDMLSESIMENLYMGLDETANSEEMKKYMEKLNIVNLYEDMDKSAFELSGGQKQKISIIRACLKNGMLYLLDEPTSALDISSTENFTDMLNEIKMKGKAILIITHDKRIIEVADSIIKI